MDATTVTVTLVFNAIGLAFYLFGQKRAAILPQAAGMALMLFPYFALSEPLMIASGIGLSLVPFGPRAIGAARRVART